MGRRGVTCWLGLVLLGTLAPAACAQPRGADATPLAGELSDREQPWTLDRLVAVAEQYNPILPRDRAQVQSARGNALQAGIWPNPRFDSNNPQVIAGRTTTLNAGIQQEIPVMGKKRLDQAAATEQVRQAEWAYHQDRYAMLAAVRQ